MIIVNASPGAGGHFIAGLVAKSLGRPELVQDKQNNESKVWIKPYSPGKVEIPDYTSYEYEDTEWREQDYPSVAAMDSSPISRCHPFQLTDDIYRENDYLSNHDLYNIVVSVADYDWVATLSTIKNLLCRYFIAPIHGGLWTHSKLIIESIDLKLFGEYCRYFTEYQVPGIPLNALPLLFYHQHYAPNKNFDIDHYKTIIQKHIRSNNQLFIDIIKKDNMLMYTNQKSEYTFDYYDIFINPSETGTMLDDYMDERRESHEKDIELVKMIDDFYGTEYVHSARSLYT